MPRRAKPLPEVIEFRIDLYALLQYKQWNDSDLARWLGVSVRTVRAMRKDPYSTRAANVLRIQSELKKARAAYEGRQ